MALFGIARAFTEPVRTSLELPRLAIFYVASVAREPATVWWYVALFAIVGVFIAWLGELLLRWRRSSTARQRELAAREAQLNPILDTVPDATIAIEAYASARPDPPQLE